MALSRSGYTYTTIQQTTCQILLAGQLKNYPKTPRYLLWLFTASSNVNPAPQWPSLCYSFDTNLVFRCRAEFFVSEGSVVPPLLSGGAEVMSAAFLAELPTELANCKIVQKKGKLTATL